MPHCPSSHGHDPSENSPAYFNGEKHLGAQRYPSSPGNQGWRRDMHLLRSDRYSVGQSKPQPPLGDRAALLYPGFGFLRDDKSSPSAAARTSPFELFAALARQPPGRNAPAYLTARLVHADAVAQYLNARNLPGIHLRKPHQPRSSTTATTIRSTDKPLRPLRPVITAPPTERLAFAATEFGIEILCRPPASSTRSSCALATGLPGWLQMQRPCGRSRAAAMDPRDHRRRLATRGWTEFRARRALYLLYP